MINALFFGVNLILLIVVWNYMLRPSILDHYRDQLFDLRESVRDYFIHRSIALDDPIYVKLREILNHHIRFTKQMSLFEIAYFSYKLEKNKSLRDEVKGSIDGMFTTDDDDLREFIANTRVEAQRILITYLVFSSATLLFIFAGIMLTKIPRLMTHSFRQRVEYFRQSVIAASGLVTSGELVEEVSIETLTGEHTALPA